MTHTRHIYSEYKRRPIRCRKHLPSVSPISWCWYTRAPGLREIPFSLRTQGQNGAHPWPKARRLKRRQKRTGSKLRRRLWALTWRRELDMMCDV